MAERSPEPLPPMSGCGGKCLAAADVSGAAADTDGGIGSLFSELRLTQSQDVGAKAFSTVLAGVSVASCSGKTGVMGGSQEIPVPLKTMVRSGLCGSLWEPLSQRLLICEATPCFPMDSVRCMAESELPPRTKIVSRAHRDSQS